jgi:hypothetical protein
MCLFPVRFSIVVSAVLAVFISQVQAAPWIKTEILKVDEGVWDSHHKKPCYKITVGVQAGECTRATVKMTSRIEKGGKKFSPSSTQNVGSSGVVEFTVPEDWLGGPGAGEEIVFQADATGYYTVVEYRTVQYIEYVPAGGGGHGSGPGGIELHF